MLSIKCNFKHQLMSLHVSYVISFIEFETGSSKDNVVSFREKVD